MKNFFQISWKLAPALLLMLVGSAVTTWAQGPKLQIDQLDVLGRVHLERTPVVHQVNRDLAAEPIVVLAKHFGSEHIDRPVFLVLNGHSLLALSLAPAVRCERRTLGIAETSAPQRTAESRSITINVKEPGSTAPRPLPPAGVGPNFAETIKRR